MTRLARVTRALSALVLALLAGLGLSSPAAAHSSQVGASPEPGSTVSAVPARVEVQFDTPLLDIGAAMVVRTAGRTVSVEPMELDRRRISVALDPASPPGEYTVAYRVVSEDGHTIESAFTFTVAGAPATASAAPSTAASAAPSTAASAAPSTAADPPPADQGGAPVLLIAVGIAVLLGVAVGALALRR